MTRPRLYQLLLGLAVLLIPMLVWVGVAGANSFRTGDNVTVASGVTLDKTVFASGRNITIAGTVNGDVFCAGMTVNISGTVNGDVMCAGQTVTITGTVNGDARLAGQTINLSGPISGNVSAAGQTLTTDSKANIGRDAQFGGTDVVLNGKVGRDLTVGGTNVTLNSVVGRDVTGAMQQLNLEPNAKVNGALEYTSDRKLNQADGAQVNGTVTRHTPDRRESHRTYGSIVKLKGAFAAYCFLAALFMGLILILLAPRAFHLASASALNHVGMTFLMGFIGSIAIPVVIGLLFATIIGIPLALVALALWLGVIGLTGFMAAYAVGRWLFRSSIDNVIAYMLLGIAILMVLYFIPFLGVLAVLAAYWFGLGMILLQLRRWPKPAYHAATIHHIDVLDEPEPSTTQPKRRKSQP